MDTFNRNDEKTPIVEPEDQQTDVDQHQEQDRQKRGLSMLMAAAFIFSEMAGAGLLTFAKALDDMGTAGFVYVAVSAVIVLLTGVFLGEAWRLVQERFPEYRGHVRYPFPAIGKVIYGRPGRALMSICISLGLYGSCIVAFLLVVNNTGQMLSDMGHPVEFHGRSAVVAGLLLPLMWFGTPKDFWHVGLGAMATSVVSGVLLVTSIWYGAAHEKHNTVKHVSPNYIDFTMAFGTVCYAFGGHIMYPTIQTDMKDGKKFTYSVLIGSIGVITMQLTIALSAYFVYGDDIADNLLFNVPEGITRYIIQSCMTLHFLLVIVLMTNPLSQEIEEFLDIPKEFNWKRCLSRTVILGSIFIITVIVPDFTFFVSLVGGSTQFITAIVCPPIFHYKVCSLEGEWETIHISRGRRILYVFIVLFGAVSGVLCVSSTTYKLVSKLNECPTVNATSPL